ncbi:MFS transporter [Acidisphaera rubrifaciens]|uniref:Major facilitator superfamily transporter n=1 Tax=Acidisphaera rubrifaciens HS-AP3 TaxID=1231350 RepID=A0A0D6P300_9PROT|nr:MFS transporter [Acidisphaera rubrifaciens]GAN76115.1 major facilitator superfamily transporter [Acidisphaera rubrifaciens HS-AP3]
MTPARLARLTTGRFHYAWVVLGIMFAVMLAAAAVRATPSVLIVPLEHQFGWSAATISAAISLNIVLFGLIGPFAAALMQTLGLKPTILLALSVLAAAVLASAFITTQWQLFLTWGLLVGIGSGAMAGGLAATVANQWFETRRGLAVGLLMASNASGQLVFLPVLAALAQAGHWRAVSFVVAGVVALIIPVVLIALPTDAARIGLLPYGARAARPAQASGNPLAVALGALAMSVRSSDFWLLFGSFAVCGFSTNGLIGTHLISFCVDHGIPETEGAALLASMGVFDLIGTTASGWLTDRYNARYLLFWYYGLRGLSLVVLPFTGFDPVSLGVFAAFYGLDWIATVPPTVALATEVFGRRSAPVVFAWILAGHQVGAAIAAFGAGEVRTLSGSYLPAFVASGIACLLASGLVLRVNRPVAVVAG